MTNEAKIIIEKARSLSASDQEEILEALLASLTTELSADADAAWRDLIDERLAALEAGDRQTFDFQDAVGELRKK